jgi:hypothetical protein
MVHHWQNQASPESNWKNSGSDPPILENLMDKSWEINCPDILKAAVVSISHTVVTLLLC